MLTFRTSITIAGRGGKIAPPLKLTLFDLVEYFIAEADGSCI
jgi:hypothetical protein